MSQRNSSILIGIFLFFSCWEAQAQTRWSLAKCIDYALEHNIQVKQSVLNQEAASNTLDQSYASFLPTLNGSATHNYYYGRSIDPTTNSYTSQQIQSNSFGLNSSIVLFEGLQLQNTLRQSRLNYLSSQYDLKKIQNDISITVVTYYLQVLYNQELLSITGDQVSATRTQRDRIKRMEELGSVSRGNLLDIEAQLASDEVRLVNAQAQFDQSMLSLQQTLELDANEGFAIEKPEVVPPTLSADQMNVNAVYAEALNTQPDIKSYEYKVLGAEKGLSIAKGTRYPRLYVGGSMNTNYSSAATELTGYTDGGIRTEQTGFTSGGDTVYSVYPIVHTVFGKIPFRDQIDRNLSKSLGFSLQVPLFNGWSTRTNVKRARINLEQTKLNQESTKKNLYKSVQQAIADANASSKKYDAGQRSVSSLREAFNYSQQRFDLGLISSYDYLQSKNNLAKAEADLLQAKYDFIFRVKILDFYLGKPLAF